MSIQASKVDPHWNYFLGIERDLETLSRYVEFDEKNFECFSIEIARLILAAGAEIDVVCKQVCLREDPALPAHNIGDYRRAIVVRFPKFTRVQVLLPRFGLTLRPWAHWNTADRPPSWWTAYNKIKHERTTEYARANLGNALNAIAGLYVVLLYLHRDKAEHGQLVPNPHMLRPHDSNFLGVSDSGYEGGFSYDLE